MSKEIQTRQGDTWDIIAHRVWGNEKLMDRLIESNLHLRRWVVFPAGVTIFIPDIEIKPFSYSPPWRTR